MLLQLGEGHDVIDEALGGYHATVLQSVLNNTLQVRALIKLSTISWAYLILEKVLYCALKGKRWKFSILLP